MAYRKLVRPLTTQSPIYQQRTRPIARLAFVITQTSSPSTQTRRDFSKEMGLKADRKVEAPNGDQVSEKDLWKYRAPYAVHDAKEDFDVKCKGNCHCGKVQFELSRDRPLASKLCHCTTCQTQHGEAHVRSCAFTC